MPSKKYNGSRHRGAISKARQVQGGELYTTDSNAGSLSTRMLFSSLTPFPPRYMCRLRYAQTKTYTTGAAGVSGTENAFSLNSLYDPDITGVGHQPYGFDQVAALYSKYIVHSVDVQLRCVTPGGSNDLCIIAAVTGAQAISLSGISVDAATEKQGIMTKTVSASGVNRNAVISLSGISIWKTLGLSKPQYLAELGTYGAAVSASPSIASVLRVNVASYDGTASETVTIQTVIIYHVEMYDRVVQGQS